MRFPTKENWAEWVVDREIQRLFVHFWFEMFSLQVPDTWQVRTTGIRSALREILQTISATREHEPYRANLPHMLKEIDAIASLDPVISRHFRHVRAYLDPFQHDDPKLIDLKRLEDTAEILLAHLATYRSRLDEELRLVLLDERHGAEKRKLNYLAMSLGTDLSTAGYSIQHLNDCASHLLDSRRDFPERLDGFLTALRAQSSKYECIVPLPPESWRLARSAAVPPLEFIGWGSLPPEISARLAASYQDTDSPRFARVHVTALDGYGAGNAARVHVEHFCAAYNLFKLTSEFRVKTDDIFVRAAGETFRAVGRDPMRTYYMRASRNAQSGVARILQLHSKLSGFDADQLAASLQHHKLGRSAPTDEARMLNFWISLECCVRQGEGTVINKLSNYVAPCLAMHNIARILRGLATYIRTYWSMRDLAPFMALLPRSSEQYLNPRDLLDVLLDEENGTRINQLFDLCGENGLVVYRIHHVRQRILRTPDRLKRNLERNRQNVGWQLRRIYRARNEVAHRGQGDPQLPRLLMHLHSYILDTLHYLTSELENRYERPRIGLALHNGATLFAHFIRVLSSDHARITRESLLEPALLVRAAPGAPVWPEDRAPEVDE